MMNREAEIVAFLQSAGWSDARRAALAGDASKRRYERLTSPKSGTAILMDAPPQCGEEVRPFLNIAGFLQNAGLSPPGILAQDPDLGLVLLEDLGDALFFSLMAEIPRLEPSLYHAACDVLLHVRELTPASLPSLDTDWLVSATDLFFDWYAPQPRSSQRDGFGKTFRKLALSQDPVTPVFVFRDFHAQNLIWLPRRQGIARVGLLDFQDALFGHPAYDLVSMLQDARRDVSVEMEEDALAYYLARSGDPAAPFRATYALLGVQRNLRILGIFARLCLRDGKNAYVDLIPRVHGYLCRNLEHPLLCDLRHDLDPLLPRPTDAFLQELKMQCTTHPQP